MYSTNGFVHFQYGQQGCTQLIEITTTVILTAIRNHHNSTVKDPYPRSKSICPLSISLGLYACIRFSILVLTTVTYSAFHMVWLDPENTKIQRLIHGLHIEFFSSPQKSPKKVKLHTGLSAGLMLVFVLSSLKLTVLPARG